MNESTPKIGRPRTRYEEGIRDRRVTTRLSGVQLLHLRLIATREGLTGPASAIDWLIYQDRTTSSAPAWGGRVAEDL